MGMVKRAVPVEVRLLKVAVQLNAGEAEKTARPVPVSSDTAVDRLAEVRPLESRVAAPLL